MGSFKGWILNITPLKDCPCPTKRNAVAHKELRAKKNPTPTPWLMQNCKPKPCKAYKELPVSQFYPVMTLYTLHGLEATLQIM